MKADHVAPGDKRLCAYLVCPAGDPGILAEYWVELLVIAGVAIVGSALLNLSTKQFFARDRPSLWESIAPETTYSFTLQYTLPVRTTHEFYALTAGVAPDADESLPQGDESG